jgi:hypothetical protein
MYLLFNQCYPNVEVGFNRFCEIRLRDIFTAETYGNHSECVCSSHQNVKLMFIGSKLKELTTEETSCKHFLSCIICNPSFWECHLGYCEHLKQMLTDLFELNAVDEVTYKQWLKTDRSMLEIITHSTEELLDIFFEKL